MTILRPLLAGLLLTTASAAYAEQITVSNVTVDTELADVENKKALEYYPALNDDLSAAITEELFPLTGENGYTVKVRVTEISLDGQPMREDKGFNTLDGWVYVYPPDVAENVSADGGGESGAQEDFNIKLTATAVGVGLMPGSDDYYRAMVAAFAQSTGEKVKDMETVEN